MKIWQILKIPDPNPSAWLPSDQCASLFEKGSGEFADGPHWDSNPVGFGLFLFHVTAFQNTFGFDEAGDYQVLRSVWGLVVLFLDASSTGGKTFRGGSFWGWVFWALAFRRSSRFQCSI